LPTTAVQRQHQLTSHALAQRVLGDQRLQFRDERCVPRSAELYFE